MSAAKKGDAVVIDYVVKTGDGRIVGGTQQQGPQTVELGGGAIFPEVEAGLVGMATGDAKAVVVPAASAFGERREELVIDIPKSQLAPEPAPQPGMQLTAKAKDGADVKLRITEVGEDTVKADANHPLAGEDLHFDLKIVDVKAA